MKKRMRLFSYLFLICFAFALGGWYMAHNPDNLWQIIHEKCAVDAHHRPCEIYDTQKAYSLLKDKKGKGQYLLIPIQKITGIEDEALIDAKTPNFLQIAWEKRDYVKRSYKAHIADEELSLAVNSVAARSQNQLHIHIDCLSQKVSKELSKLPWFQEAKDITLGGYVYHVTPLEGLSPSPFLRFAHLTQEERGRHGLAILYQSYQGKSRFLLLEENVTGLNFGEAEYLQDHHCHAIIK